MEDWTGLIGLRWCIIDGFFDAGMLQQALKASQEDKDPRPSEKAATQMRSSRGGIGKRLRLGEY